MRLLTLAKLKEHLKLWFGVFCQRFRKTRAVGELTDNDDHQDDDDDDDDDDDEAGGLLAGPLRRLLVHPHLEPVLQPLPRGLPEHSSNC